VSTARAFLLALVNSATVRVFLIAFAGVLIPGALGWLNDLTQWAKSDGQAPLPSWHSLAFLGIAAIAAGFIALLNAVLTALTTATVAAKATMNRRRGDDGRAQTLSILSLIVALFVVGVLLVWLT
jgi:hypothetical protein